MEGFLNNLPKFNNSLLNLLFNLFSIKIISLRSFLYRLITKTYYFQRFCNSNIYTSVTSTLHIKPDICYKIRIYRTFTTIPTLLLLDIISNKILNSKHFYLQIYSKFNRIIMKCGQNVVNIVFNF